MTAHPTIGVGTIIFDENRVLMGLRKGSHGGGTWCFPGGHLEMYETPEKCAIRETFEETGLKIKNLTRGPWTNDIFQNSSKHYISIFMLAAEYSGEIAIKEQSKFVSWEWINYQNLPDPLFFSIQNLLASGYSFKKLRTMLSDSALAIM
jgi:8-oxo-dGTP diphosphatase